MAAIVPSANGVELAQVAAEGHNPLKANQVYGRVKVSTFTINTGSGIAQNTVVAAAKLPRGARLLRGRIDFGAMGTSATAEIGLAATDGGGYLDVAGTVDDDVDKLLAAGNVAAAGQLAFVDTAALGMLYETEKEVYLVVKATGAAWAASKTLQGYILYSVD